MGDRCSGKAISAPAAADAVDLDRSTVTDCHSDECEKAVPDPSRAVLGPHERWLRWIATVRPWPPIGPLTG